MEYSGLVVARGVERLAFQPTFTTSEAVVAWQVPEGVAFQVLLAYERGKIVKRENAEGSTWRWD